MMTMTATMPKPTQREDTLPKLELSGVSLRYSGSGDAGSHLALQDINLRVAPGEFVAIVGPSGCGKSTLLRIISGLMKPTHGVVRIDNNEVRDVPPRMGFVFQSDALLPWKTAEEVVTIGGVLAGRDAGASQQKAQRLLEELGLGQALHKHPGELSGGMRKRVSLTRTMAYEPTIFLLDEPFSALDAQTRIHVGNRFLEVLERLGQTAIFVTHDIEEAIALADRVIVMTASPGRIAADFVVDLPRPRDYYRSRFEPGFRELQERVWEVLRTQMQGVLAAEEGAKSQDAGEAEDSAAAFDRGTAAARRRARIRGLADQALATVLPLLAWQLLAQSDSARKWISSPIDVAERLWAMLLDGSLEMHTWATVSEAALGLLAGIVLGLLPGLLLGFWPRLSKALDPIVMGFYSLPRVSLAPLFIIWLGIGLVSKAALVASMVLFVVLFNVREGIRNIDPDIVDSFRSMNASRAAMLRHVVIPSLIPWLVTAVRIGIGMALVGAVVGEMIASSRGLGWYVNYATNIYDMTGAITALVALMALAMAFNAILGILERRVMTWRRSRE